MVAVRRKGGTRLRIILLMVFGIAGTLSRCALQGMIQDGSGVAFPAGTLIVNLLGCFLLGEVGQFALNHLSFPPDLRVGLTIGFFGAFTTFSTFGWETVHMLDDGEWIRAIAYVGASVIGGLLLVRLGMSLGNRL